MEAERRKTYTKGQNANCIRFDRVCVLKVNHDLKKQSTGGLTKVSGEPRRIRLFMNEKEMNEPFKFFTFAFPVYWRKFGG